MALWRFCRLNTACRVLPLEGQRSRGLLSHINRIRQGIKLQIRVLSSGKTVVEMELSGGMDSRQESRVVPDSGSASVKKPRRQFNFKM